MLRIAEGTDGRVFKIIESAALVLMHDFSSSEDIKSMYGGLRLHEATDILLPINDQQSATS